MCIPAVSKSRRWRAMRRFPLGRHDISSELDIPNRSLYQHHIYGFLTLTIDKSTPSSACTISTRTLARARRDPSGEARIIPRPHRVPE